MKKLIIFGMLIISLLLSGCLTTEDCKDIALKQAKEWQELGYNQGFAEDMDRWVEERNQIIDTYTPMDGCYLVIFDKFSMRNICTEDEYYEVLR